MTYDPSERYVWKPDEKIELSGEEFAMMVNAVRSVLNLPEAQTIILAYQATQAADKIMERYVAAGVIKPMQQQPPTLKINEEDDKES